MKKRFFGLLCALVLTLSLMAVMPMGAFALTGLGTEKSPFIVTSYDELRSVLNSLSKDTYIKLGANINSYDTVAGNYLSVKSKGSETYTAHLDLNGKYISRVSNASDGYLFYVNNAELIVDDAAKSGWITLGEGPAKTVFTVSDAGKLVINQCKVETDRHKVLVNHGYTVINGGTLENTGSTELINNRGKLEINGGELSSQSNVRGVLYCTDDSTTTIAGAKIVYTGTQIPNYNGYYIGGDPGFKVEAYDGVFSSPNVKCRAIPADAISDSSSIAVDGKSVIKSSFPTSYYNKLTLVCKLADKATVNIIVPEHDNKPQYATVSDTLTFLGTATSCKWYDITAGKDVGTEDTFIGGHKYRMTATIHVENDYVIGSTPSISINNDPSIKPTVTKLNDKLCEVTAEFDCPKKVISNVYVDLIAPKGGKKINNFMGSSTMGAVVCSGKLSPDTRNKGYWYHGIDLMKTGDTFEEGESYVARFNIVPDEGYEFADDLAVKVNGKTASLYATSGEYLTYEVRFTATKVLSVVNLSVTEPAAGNNPAKATVTSEGATIVSQLWTLQDGSDMISSEKFEAGKRYYLKIVVKPKDNYEFADFVSATINRKMVDLHKNSDGTWYCGLWFTVPEASTRKKGDVVKNDKIDNADLLAVKSHIKKIKTLTGDDLWAADVDGNGAVNNTDLIVMKSHIKGVKKLW